MTHRFRWTAWVAALALAAMMWTAPPAGAVLSERGGTGLFELATAESKRPARLELGFFTSYSRLGLRDSLDTQLNALRAGANLAFGMPGGFELSGTLPLHGYSSTRGSGGSPFAEDGSWRLGDLSGRLRWTGPLPAPGLRWGWEGDVTFATGDDETMNLPGRGEVKPFTASRNLYTGRLMTTWDGLRAGSPLPVRLHAAGGYTFVANEDRYLVPRAPLPLELPGPPRNRDNDYLSLGAGLEVDLPRVTLFTEFATDQLVHQRGLVTGRENRMTLSPGLRFWAPGGLSVSGAYSIPLSDDDAATAFDPGRAFPDPEWRIGISLGTVYRGARDRMSGSPAAAPAMAGRDPGTAAARPAATPSGDGAMIATVDREAEADDTVPAGAGSGMDRQAHDAASHGATSQKAKAHDAKSGGAKSHEAKSHDTARKAEQTRDILERRDVQESPEPAVAAAKERGGRDGELRPAAMTSDRDDTRVEPRRTPANATGTTPAPVRVPDRRFLDSDGDGVVDERDQCPLVAEDWDGFQDLDGCPDLDNDRDGIPDVRDGCPNDPETYNGYYDHDGCPDESAARWVEPRDEAPESRGVKAAGPAPVTRSVPGPDSGETPAGKPATAMPETKKAEETKKAGSAPAMKARDVRPDAAAAAPPLEPGAAGSLRADLDRHDLAVRDLEGRVRTLELRQEWLTDLSSARPAPMAGLGTTMLTPRAATTDADLNARVAVLENELDRLRAAQARTDSPDAAATGRRSGAAETAPAAPADPGAEQRSEILDRLGRLEAGLESRRTAAATAATPEGDPAPAGSDEAERLLDLLMARGATAGDPEIRFAPGSARLAPGAMTTLGTIAGALRGVPAARVAVIGHTDATGHGDANLRLSRARARAVADALIRLGADPAQITIEGRGEDQPIASNATDEGRRLNRRIEFVWSR